MSIEALKQRFNEQEKQALKRKLQEVEERAAHLKRKLLESSAQSDNSAPQSDRPGRVPVSAVGVKDEEFNVSQLLAPVPAGEAKVEEGNSDSSGRVPVPALDSADGAPSGEEYVRTLELKSQAEWKQWSKSGQRPDDIPSNPDQIYKDKGWLSWPDWLGYGEGRTSST